MNTLASYDRFYLEHVINLSESEKVVFIDDVLTDRNVMLIERDSVFNPKVYELLRNHKLKCPLDDLIFVVHRLSISDVVERARELEASTPYLQALDKSLPQRDLLINALSRIELNGVLSNKLTVMQRCMPALFDHSIQVAMMAVAIGIELRVAAPLLSMVAAAGLLHDLGELHINPVLHQPGTKFSENEWNQVYSHPLIGYSIINQFQEYPAQVARAVLEHHERMDGSGYPQATPGGKLSPLGRILAAAEVVTAICQREPASHVDTVFKSYVSNLDENVEQALNKLLRRMQSHLDPAKAGVMPSIEVDPVELQNRSAAISRIMRSWKKLSRILEDNLLERSHRLVSRMTQIQLALRNAGIEPEECEASVKSFAGEEELMVEIFSLLREICYQFGSIVNETQRAWNFEAERKSATTMAVEKWLAQTRAVLNAVDNNDNDEQKG